MLRELGSRLDASVRTVDRVAHGDDGRVHHVAVVLPETAKQGADVFHGRLVESVQGFLTGHVSGQAAAVQGVVVDGMTCTVPGDDDALAARLQLWAAIDAVEHEAARR